ncbi:MAG: TRAP transporter TatT component family protein [Gammaproteobacteria bacterium]|nr:TRAP transporter TatT component family protein [Gammaproteobacteria bacterium]
MTSISGRQPILDDSLQRLCGALVPLLLLSACSMGTVVVRGTQTILDSGIAAMNRETDLDLAKAAMPANLKLLEGMLIEDPGNKVLRLYAAEGFYGYAYGFVEIEDRERAKQLYRRCYEHARLALEQSGISMDPEASPENELEAAVARAGKAAVPALFWSASCLGNWVNLNRDNPAGIAELSSTAILMRRVLELDETFYHGGAHLFFGVYYGGRSPMFGGNFERAEQHFRRAHEINREQLLLVDLLYAEYLARQRLDRDAFHQHLTRILESPVNLNPDLALVNAIARQRAGILIKSEDDWF